jgi:MoaA/NifB/PqqE/SkfB family radical SAM enzyme
MSLLSTPLGQASLFARGRAVKNLFRDILRYNILPPRLTSPELPRALTIYVTYRCNMRCRICGIWKTNNPAESRELSLEEWDDLFADPLFSAIEFININGGEPNLRKDLVLLVERLIAGHRHLSALSLNSNGIPPEKTIFHAERIAGLCRKRNIRFSISLSLHGIGEGLDQITGLKNSYASVQQAFAGLKRLRRHLPFYVSANCVISRLNLYSLDEMLAWSRREEIPVNFVLGEVRDRFHNAEMQEDVLIGDKDKPALVAFLCKLAGQKRRFGHHALRYRHLADMIGHGKSRSLACHYFLSGAVVGSDGLLFYCKNSEPIGDCRTRSASAFYLDQKSIAYKIHGLRRDRCLNCPPYTMNAMEVAKDFLKILADYAFHH